MLYRIVDHKNTLQERETCYNKVRLFLYDLSCDYPFFGEWLEKVFKLTATEERSIITCESDDNVDIIGVCIIKNTEEEKKICTLRVASRWQGYGIGSKLISMAIGILGEKYPLATVPQQHIDVFKKFFEVFNFKVVDKVRSVYNDGLYEYYFNKPCIRENVLMSINPIYVDLIINGKKKVEFRKTCFDRKVKRVYIYSTLPQKQIVGYFEIKRIDMQTPSKLWKEYNQVGGIPKSVFYDYFYKKEKGYAILIDKIIPFRYGINLMDVFGERYSVPQNFRYIDNVRALHLMNLLIDK